MKSFISFIKKNEVAILLVGLLFGAISFVASFRGSRWWVLRSYGAINYKRLTR